MEESETVTAVNQAITAKYKALARLDRRIRSRISSFQRRDLTADATDKARDFIENADYYLPEELEDLGIAARAYPDFIGAYVRDLLEPTNNFVAAYISMCERVLGKAGSTWRVRGRPKQKIEVIASHLKRAMATIGETFVLLSSGFPDGAEARSRTTMELSTIARFLEENATVISLRFRSSHHVEMRRRMKAGHLGTLNEETIEYIENEYLRVLRTFGPEMKDPYGWASPVFGNKRVTYSDLSRDYGAPNSASRYSNASHHVHAVQTGAIKADLADAGGNYRHGPRPLGFYVPAYESLESLHQCALSLLREVRKSSGNVEVDYWVELLEYTVREAQLEVTHAQSSADPEWARATYAKMTPDENIIALLNFLGGSDLAK